MRETPEERVEQRTLWNARDSDATVIFSLAPELRGGTGYTLDVCRELGRPCLILAGDPVEKAAWKLLRFVTAHRVHTLNVAGPRKSEEPAIRKYVFQVLEEAAKLAPV